MVKGVSSDIVSSFFKLLPHKARIQVKTITTDLSSAMMLTARKCFPAAKLINDRFHVQQLLSEAVDQIRIRLRWEILDDENKKIQEHRLKRKDAKNKIEREKIGPWIPIRMSNGETMAQIIAKSKHIILKNKSKWNLQQTERAEILFKLYPGLKKAYDLSMKLTEIFNRKIMPEEARLSLAKWYNEVEQFGDCNLNKTLETFQNHNVTIINYFEKRLTNASAESFNAKIKALRSQFRGVSDIKFFMYRLTKLYA